MLAWRRIAPRTHDSGMLVEARVPRAAAAAVATRRSVVVVRWQSSWSVAIGRHGQSPLVIVVSRGWWSALSGVVGVVRRGGGRSWSVVVVVRSLSVGHRCQLPLLVNMAVTVTHLVVGAARHRRHPPAHCSEAQTSMGPCRIRYLSTR
jgi:hypothetical protein